MGRRLLLLISTFTLIIIVSLFTLGVLADRSYLESRGRIVPKESKPDSVLEMAWTKEFKVVTIPSSIDRKPQSAYFIPTESKDSMPLLVSLHTWGGGFAQEDPLANLARKNRWNYIHPDFRGPNSTVEACLSEKALADIDDAIQYALDTGSVDLNNIFVVGASGGGYATLGSYIKSRHKVRLFLSWVPISDLSAWFYQSQRQGNRYDRDIQNCTSSTFGTLNEAEARKRSPLSWELSGKPRGRIEIYAGIDDGYSGSVPVSHSIFFFNKLARHYGSLDAVVPDEDTIKILTRALPQTAERSTLDGRLVLYKKDTPKVGLTIFDGGHEMLANYTFQRMQAVVRNESPKK